MTTDATCETDGSTVYTAAVTDSASLDGKDHSDNKSVKIEATGHNYGQLSYSWSDDNKSVTATAVCANNSNHKITETAQTKYTVLKEATAEEDGSAVYTVAFDNEAFEDQSRQVVIPALGHVFEFIGFTWTKEGDDYSATANYKCTTENDHYAQVDANVASNVKKEATCTEDGLVDYTATVSAGYSLDRTAHSSEKTNQVIPAKGHAYGTPKYVWEDDYSAVTATMVCANDAEHKVTETVSATGKTTDPTCDKDGATVYTSAEFENEAFETQTKTVAIPANGHQFTLTVAKEVTCTEDGNIDYYTCGVCGKHYSYPDGEKELKDGSWVIHAEGHEMTAHEAVAVTCTEDGSDAYWSCDKCGKFFKDEEGETEIADGSWVIKAGGHTYGAPEYTWSDDYSELEAKIVCTKCDEETDGHTITETVDVTSVTTDPTCVDPGSITYTSEEFEKEAFTKQTKTVTIDALGHDWSEWKEITAATETTKGTEKRTCSRCDAFETREIPVLVHVHGLTKVNAKEATCTEEGNIEYWICDKGEHPCGRLYSDENGQTELDRSEVVISAKGHELTKTEAVGATCTEAGNSAYWTCAVCGKHFSDSEGKTEIAADSWVIKALGHDWGNWTVTKAATATAYGEEARKCSRCDAAETRPIKKLDPGSDPNKKGSDGTAVGPGASAASAAQAITNMAADTDLPGAAFGKLTLRSPKQGKNSITLSWAGVSGASKYVIYGNKCGKGNKPVKIAEVSGTTITRSNLAKGTYYKYIAVALDKNNMVVSTSKLIHVATKGGKVGNHKSVKVAKAVTKKAKALKVGKSLKLKAKAVPQSKKLKVKKHVAVRYESTNPSIATVSSKGTVKARSKGTCYVYAYAQNGVFKRIKITVK